MTNNTGVLEDNIRDTNELIQLAKGRNTKVVDMFVQGDVSQSEKVTSAGHIDRSM